MKIAIIGAGPAGAMAAIRLARAGASVQLFDPSHPREKPCGGGVTGRALALIADVVDLKTLAAVVVKSATVEAQENGSRTPFPARVDLLDRGIARQSSLVVLSRAVFDAALVNAAVESGAQLSPRKVVKVTRGNEQILVATARAEYAVDFVVGADGANSLVRKTFSRPFTRAEMSIAAGYLVDGASSPDIVIACVAEQPGYLWSFPRLDHLAVGVCARAIEGAAAGKLRAQSLAWIRSHGLYGGGDLRQYAWPIPSAGFGRAVDLRAAGERWMLVGDAAGLVDPLTREGIYYALLSGGWAAEALMRSPAHAAASYQQRVTEEIYPELSRAAALSGLFFSRDFSNAFVAALRESGRIRDVFRDLVAGAQPYGGLRRRLLATREWKLAGRAALLVVQSTGHFLPEFARSSAGL